MAFQNAQEPTEEPWGPNISEEESNDEAAGGGVDLDATKEEDSDEGISYFNFTSDEESEEGGDEESEGEDEESEGGGEVARRRFRLPVSHVVREYLRRIVDGEKKRICLENLKVRYWLHQNAYLFLDCSEEDTPEFICKTLCLPPKMSTDEIGKLFVESPKVLCAVLLTVHYYATESIQCMTPDPALKLAYRVWVFPWNEELRNMLNSAQ
ncbi:hypothetical protein MAJ_00676, partial [Metarhizium majus ARSEF 297]